MNKLMFLLIIFSQLGMWAQSTIESDYSRAVFMDQNFKFNGEKLEFPDLEKAAKLPLHNKLPSSCYDDIKDRKYTCYRESDSTKYQVEVSNKNANNMDVSFVSPLGLKDEYDNLVVSQSINSKIKSGSVKNQIICSYDAIQKSLHQDITEFKCHLLTKKACDLISEVNDFRNASKNENPKVWSQFTNYLESSEYKNLLKIEATKAHSDIFLMINQNAPGDVRKKYNTYDNSKQLTSTIDIIRERERTLPTPIKTPNDFRKVKDLKREIGKDFTTRCSRLRSLWNVPSVRDQVDQPIDKDSSRI